MESGKNCNKLLFNIEKLLKHEIPRKIIQGFEPTQNLRSVPPKPKAGNKGKGRPQGNFKSSRKARPSRSNAFWHKKRPKKNSDKKGRAVGILKQGNLIRV